MFFVTLWNMKGNSFFSYMRIQFTVALESFFIAESLRLFATASLIKSMFLVDLPVLYGH